MNRSYFRNRILISISALELITLSVSCTPSSSDDDEVASFGGSNVPQTSQGDLDDSTPDNEENDENSRPDTRPDSANGETDHDSEESGTDSSSEGEDEDEAEPKFDIEQPDTVEVEAGCEKVDFLFVVDSSTSMKSVQDSLIRSFPLFIDSIKSTLPPQGSYQIMVVDTDEFGICSAKNCAEPPNDKWIEKCIEDESNGYACRAEYTECDMTIGAGVTHPTGSHSSNQLCDFPEGSRFLHGDDPNLYENFECAGRVGTAGNAHEKPMDALVHALSKELNSEGGCNQGFLRDDAILVVAFFSNDNQYRDAGTPEEWHSAVVEAKNGDLDASVVIGVTPTEDCSPGTDGLAGKHWRDFVSLFGERGLQGRICDEDFSPLFSEAVGIVKDACDDFVPPE